MRGFECPAPFLPTEHDFLLFDCRTALSLMLSSIISDLRFHCTYISRRPVAQHILAIEQVAIVLPDFLTCRAMNPLWYILGELRLRYESKGDWKTGNHSAEEGQEEKCGGHVFDADRSWCWRGKVVLPFAISRDPTHRK